MVTHIFMQKKKLKTNFYLANYFGRTQRHWSSGRVARRRGA
jgi:hypothetical protein